MALGIRIQDLIYRRLLKRPFCSGDIDLSARQELLQCAGKALGSLDDCNQSSLEFEPPARDSVGALNTHSCSRVESVEGGGMGAS